jgi:hypothetical protein
MNFKETGLLKLFVYDITGYCLLISPDGSYRCAVHHDHILAVDTLTQVITLIIDDTEPRRVRRSI